MNYLDQKKGFLGFDAKHKSKSQVVVVPFGLEKTVELGTQNAQLVGGPAI